MNSRRRMVAPKDQSLPNSGKASDYHVSGKADFRKGSKGEILASSSFSLRPRSRHRAALSARPFRATSESGVVANLIRAFHRRVQARWLEMLSQVAWPLSG